MAFQNAFAIGLCPQSIKAPPPSKLLLRRSPTEDGQRTARGARNKEKLSKRYWKSERSEAFLIPYTLSLIKAWAFVSKGVRFGMGPGSRAPGRSSKAPIRKGSGIKGWLVRDQRHRGIRIICQGPYFLSKLKAIGSKGNSTGMLGCKSRDGTS